MKNHPLDDDPPLREWAYLIQLIGPSWAGTYGNSAFIGSVGNTGDGNLIKQGGGIEGRVTGGMIEARTEAEIRLKLDGMYVLKKTERDQEGNEQEIVTQTYRLLSLEPRGVISLM